MEVTINTFYAISSKASGGWWGGGWSQGGKEEKMEMKCKWFEFSGVGDESCGGRHLLKGLIKSFNGVQTSRS